MTDTQVTALRFAGLRACGATVRRGGETKDIDAREVILSSGAVHSPATLLRAVEARKLDPAPLITHRYSLDRILDAYKTFANAAETGALKVLVSTAT